VVRKRRGRKEACEALSSSEESVVVMGDGEYVKVHLHTRDRESTRKGLAASGDILQWSDDNLETQTAAFQGLLKQQAIHIMTDAAGSLTREDAQKRGITLLDSYITVGGTSLPETCFAPSEIYAAMRKGIRVTTSQASDAERHHWYQQALSLSKQVLYLCVGSGFTGNHTAALQWKNNFDPDNRMLVMDTQAASGSLGVLAITTAQHAKGNAQPHEVVAFAREAAGRCGEYIFIDTLKYLAAGGRLSTTGAFFGDMLHMKPVISPGAGGAKKVGVVRNSEDQIRFALQKLAKALSPDGSPLIMLEYSDNREWVESRAAQEVQKRYPSAEMLIKPLSLTTGVHTGPGTWAVAYVAEKGRSA
ncbi:MAG: DegV family protein, partial [Pseudomonadota bacterium]